MIYLKTTILLLILGLFLVSCQKDDKHVQLDEPSVLKDSVYSADSVVIQYEKRGSGDKALVFVHCWCCDQIYWSNQVNYFADKYKIITLDLAGHGNSGMNREKWSIEAYAGDVAAVVNKEKLKDIILIGHSMGGMVIIEAAHLLGEKVTALIGVDNYRNFNRTLNKEQIDGFLQNFQDNFPAFTKGYVAQIFSPVADSGLVKRISDDMSSAPSEVGIESMKSIMYFDYRAKLKDLKIPIRGINGDLFPTDMESNKEVTGYFDAVIIPETGHFPHLEKPDEFNQHLLEYLQEFWK
jgi:pimeloyl-ACP methyl ester carboxylesterase